tara:strand:- start:6389 stop:7429 length:1041 start_codon:yes stop_codon:yes gene_type:complete
MIDRQFLQTVPQYGIGGFVGKIFKNVKKAVKKVAEPAGAALGFMIGGPAGASIGAGIGSLVAGKNPERALSSALLAYGIGNLAGAGAFGKTIQGMSGKGIPTFGLTDGNLFSGIGPRGQLITKNLNLFGGPGPDGKSALPVEVEKANNILENAENYSMSEVLDARRVVDNFNKKGFGFNLGTGLTAASIALPIGTYLSAKKAEEDFVAPDPNALNPLYYMNPEEYQIAGQGVSPYYMSNLQDAFGVPVSDLPTDFVRGVAEGGIIQLADGSEKYFPRKNGAIDGPGTGTSDDIPAMLSDGEFVFTAKAVRNAGGGDRREGAKRMYQTMKNLEKGGKLSLESRGQAA